MLIGVYNTNRTILKSLTYLSFDSIRNRRESGNKTICMVRLYIEPRLLGENKIAFDLARGRSNCIIGPDLSTGDVVGSVVAAISESLRTQPENYRLSGQSNITASALQTYVEEFRDNSESLQIELTDRVKEIPLKDMDKLLFENDRITLKIIDRGDKDE